MQQVRPVSRIRIISLCAFFTALTGICSQIQIPLPMVPINLALFAVHMAAALLGPQYGTLSIVCYIALGLVGVPVFAGFSGGAGSIMGPTGGYIVGYAISAILTALVIRKWGRNPIAMVLGMVLGATACYGFGTVWFMVVTGMDLITSLFYCVIPFLAGDGVKILLACLLVRGLVKPLSKMGLLYQ